MQVPKSYLPFKNCHIVAINGLSPDELKISAKKIKKDRERISHNSILNFVAKSLGIKGGFAEYARMYEEEIQPFMDAHGLNKHADLITPRNVGYTCFTFKLSRQSLSERLFVSGLPIPEKIFTGYDFDYENTISDGFYYFNRLVSYGDDQLFDVINTYGGKGKLSDVKLIPSFKGLMPGDSKLAVDNNIAIARDYGESIVPGSGDYNDRLLKDFVLGGRDWDINAGFNLLGDDLVLPREQGSVIELYKDSNTTPDSYSDSLAASMSVMSLFRDRIDNCDSGWVEVLPFNQNLCFIKGKNGQFDIIIKNVKNDLFKHEFMSGELKVSDVPYFIDDYHFFRWHYFEYQGWSDMDRHESEKHFYSSGGSLSEYPGIDEIFISYYKSIGKFTGRVKLENAVKDGFICSKVMGKDVCISSLISIDVFSNFLSEFNEYSSDRAGDDVLTVNADTDRSQPAACTWFDALAFCKWYSIEHGIPVRLLSSDEYMALRKDSIGFSQRERIHSDLIFTNPKSGVVYKQHPPYMGEGEFQSLHVTYRAGIPNIRLDNGLEFLNSNDFSEWMQDKTCIRSASLGSFHGTGHASRSKPPLHSSGKYKHQKIGFRICYDIFS